MQDDAICWDPTTIYPEPSTALKIYVIFALIAIVGATTRLVALWIVSPPFRLPPQRNNPVYWKRLCEASHSVKQWMGCMLLAGGMVATIDFRQTCNRLLMAKRLGSSVILLVIRDSILGLSFAMLVALFLFLARWHVLNRIAHLRKLNTSVTT